MKGEYVSPFQNQKHFSADSGDIGKDQGPVHVDKSVEVNFATQQRYR